MTAAKKTPERCWLGEVSSVVLQQSLRDLEAAYRAFFEGLAGRRPKVGAPRFKSRKDNRQSVRFTANARSSITPGGKLALPKVGEVKVRWSRRLPAIPSTVTVVKDAAGRFFASFVVESSDEPLPEPGTETGVDLGLEHFAVLSDGRKIASPRFLRRAEKKLRKAQQALCRKQKGSSNRDKARTKAARAHARVADARREFHHRLSTARGGTARRAHEHPRPVRHRRGRDRRRHRDPGHRARDLANAERRQAEADAHAGRGEPDPEVTEAAEAGSGSGS